MTTGAFVTMVMEWLGSGWTRQRIREVANRCQNELLGTDCKLMRIKPDPFFASTDETYSYVASSSLYVSTTGEQGALVGDIRAVRDLYTLSAIDDILTPGQIGPTSSRPYTFERTARGLITHAVFDGDDSIEPDSSDCTIKWWAENNPGDTTTTWRGVAYKWPTQLDTENIALSVPADFHDTLFLEMVLARTEKREYGRATFTKEDYEKEKKRFVNKYQRMSAAGETGWSVPREC